MKTGVRSTSRQAFFNDVKPKLGQKQHQVLMTLQMAKRPVCNQELAEYLDWPINAVTPRVAELRELGKVEEACRAVYPVTNRKVIYWQPKKQEEIANECLD